MGPSKILAMAAALTASAAHAGLPDIDKPAPALAAYDDAGKAVDLSRFRGRAVVLEWTNSGCPFVRHVYSSGVMQGLQRRATGQGVVWLTVISSAPGKQGFLTAPQVKQWKASTGAAPADVLLDPTGTVGRAYGARATPTLYVVDPRGVLVYMGGIDDRASTDPADARKAKNYIALALDDLRAGRPIVDKVTPSYGCSVKY
jgi:hypothetical protein